jgi:hypothetical protein
MKRIICKCGRLHRVEISSVIVRRVRCTCSETIEY